jgi:methylthioribulose-1-phosphate dehydratase
MADDAGKTPIDQLAQAGAEFYRRGWVLGTSGNFSVLIARSPMRVTITSSGNEKGTLDETKFLDLDANSEILQGFGTPSSDTLLHLAIYRLLPRARCVLHSHSVWGTMLSDRFFESGGVDFAGYEILKGLSRVETHEHRERLPIIENSTDQLALSHVIENVLRDNPNLHGILLRRHGLYAWGESVEEARRHVEIFEFLFEVTARQ